MEVIRSWDARAIAHEERVRHGWVDAKDRRDTRPDKVKAEALWSFLRGLRLGEHPIIAGAVALNDATKLIAIMRGEPFEKQAWSDAALAMLGEATWDVLDVYPLGLFLFTRLPEL